MKDPDYIAMVLATKDDISSGDTSGVVAALKKLIVSRESALSWKESVEFSVCGYDNAQIPLSDIPEIRSFVAAVDREFPYWLFFLSKRTFGMLQICRCLLPSRLTVDEQALIFPDKLADLLSHRWFPAMNYVCAWVGLSEVEIENMSNRVFKYFEVGPIS